MFSLPSTASFTRLLLVCVVFLSLGCGVTLRPIEPVETRYIEFQCDPIINDGKPLAIDIIYITYVQELREVTRLGPRQWFETENREQWKFKESITLKGGDRAVVKLDPVILDRTVLLVIFANYKSVFDPAYQQVVVDFAGNDTETIEVQKSRLQPVNKSLRYVK